MQGSMRPVARCSLRAGQQYPRYFRSKSFGVQVVAGKGFGQLTKPKKEEAPTQQRSPIMPGRVSGMLSVPNHIVKPDWYQTGRQPASTARLEIHDEEGRERMRAAGRLASQVLDLLTDKVQPGVTTDELDRIAHKFIIENGAYPSPLNYGNFPKSVCTSINEIICHGIPDDRKLQDGDIMNIDVTVYLDGYHGDTSRMYYVGNVSEEAQRLCEVCKEARDLAISRCGPGVKYREIGSAIQKVADKNGYYVVRDFVGHGVGQRFHASPVVYHHGNNHPGQMKLHQTFTIEPMLNEKRSGTRMWSDNWTAMTTDRCLSAQWEHTILITQNGHEILTKSS
eukprot:TRINITY_DN62669_c0_g1_i1.p1 TRINITY_DN62669_c0_g1~~TRINITY_DN62669_c0_g1_i1.p1  ORF type:complete len:337 (-),score=35.19 TRINITY_DN62669_c0_g1_i1:293-1303(-)